MAQITSCREVSGPRRQTHTPSARGESRPEVVPRPLRRPVVTPWDRRWLGGVTWLGASCPGRQGGEYRLACIMLTLNSRTADPSHRPLSLCLDTSALPSQQPHVPQGGATLEGARPHGLARDTSRSRLALSLHTLIACPRGAGPFEYRGPFPRGTLTSCEGRAAGGPEAKALLSSPVGSGHDGRSPMGTRLGTTLSVPQTKLRWVCCWLELWR